MQPGFGIQQFNQTHTGMIAMPRLPNRGPVAHACQPCACGMCASKALIGQYQYAISKVQVLIQIHREGT